MRNDIGIFVNDENETPVLKMFGQRIKSAFPIRENEGNPKAEQLIQFVRKGTKVAISGITSGLKEQTVFVFEKLFDKFSFTDSAAAVYHPEFFSCALIASIQFLKFIFSAKKHY